MSRLMIKKESSSDENFERDYGGQRRNDTCTTVPPKRPASRVLARAKTRKENTLMEILSKIILDFMKDSVYFSFLFENIIQPTSNKDFHGIHFFHGSFRSHFRVIQTNEITRMQRYDVYIIFCRTKSNEMCMYA